MLLYHCIREAAWPQVATTGLKGRVHLLVRLDDALSTCPDRVLVVDGAKLPEPIMDAPEGGLVTVSEVPAGALLNADPYLPPRPVTAAGGFVVRPGAGEPEILMIFRRGLWDIPKGKLDPGETIPQCALREVREEVGIHDLVLIQGLGATVHGFPGTGKYQIKTTYWYQMQTSQEHFIPQKEEDIEEVAWVAWDRAVEQAGFPSLRRHLQHTRSLITLDPTQNSSSSSSK